MKAIEAATTFYGDMWQPFRSIEQYEFPILYGGATFLLIELKKHKRWI